MSNVNSEILLEGMVKIMEGGMGKEFSEILIMQIKR